MAHRSDTSLSLPIDRWTPRASAPYMLRADLRRLLVIEHPWVPSETANAGEWSCTVSPPDGWRPGQPLYLSFYQSDNYSGVYAPNEWLGVQAFVGHRFKQVLVNGQVVWESDVADEEMTGEATELFTVAPGQPGFHNPYCVIDIGNFVQREMVLTLRVVDKIASTECLEGDHYRRFSWSRHDPAVAARNFSTAVFFGDVVLSLDPSPQPTEAAPVRVSERPARLTAFPSSGVRFTVETPGRLPLPGFPVRTGVPFPQGALPANASPVLQDDGGAQVPCAATGMSYWPDGSVKWLLCEFVARRKSGYRLLQNGGECHPATPVQVHDGPQGTVISTGLVAVKIASAEGSGVLQGIESIDGVSLDGMDLSVKMNRVGWRDHYTAYRLGTTIERQNPVCVVVRIDGEMRDPQGQRFGPWQVRLHLWAGLPYLLVDWRLVNETDQAMAMLLDWSARIRLPELHDARVNFGHFTSGYDPEDIAVKAMGHFGTITDPVDLPLYKDSEYSCRQERERQARLYRNTSWVATAETAPGYVNLRHPKGGVVGAMRWFSEEYPKGIVVRPDRLTLATLPESEDAVAWGHDRPFVRLGRGEAKRQSFALWLHDGALPDREAERFNGCVQDAPRLWNQQWYIASGALDAGPSVQRSELTGWRERVIPDIERTGIHASRLGHREYWDTCWSNDYRGRTHIGLLQYLETGDPRWFRYFDAACTHNRDVDIIHYCPEHPDWVGACHGYGEDHTSSYPMGNIGMNCDGMLEHYLLTGDPDSLAAARGLAERLLVCVNERCARTIGWPLSQLVRWYEHTGDARFLARAEELELLARTYIEPRRGTCPEVHGCWNYPGNVAFMVGYLGFGLMRYHRLTGSRATLQALARLAAGLFAENRIAPGIFRYSPFPENNPTPGSHYFNPLIGGIAGYLYLVTGDSQYGAWAQECYDGMVMATPDTCASMDMFQSAGWMLHALLKYQARARRHRSQPSVAAGV